MPLPTGVYLRRSVPEVALNAAANGVGGTQQFSIPAEMWGARLMIQSVITGGPTAVSIPILASADGITFNPLQVLVTTGTGDAAYDTVTLTSLTGDMVVVPIAGAMAIKVGPITLTGGVSPTATVTIRIQ